MCVSVLQEAVSTGDPELVQLVLQYRDFKRATERLAGIPELLSKLRQVKLPLSQPADWETLSLQVLNFICQPEQHTPILSHASKLWQTLLTRLSEPGVKIKAGVSTRLVCYGQLCVPNMFTQMHKHKAWCFLTGRLFCVCLSNQSFPGPLPGAGLLCGDEVGVHQLGWVCFLGCVVTEVSFSTSLVGQLPPGPAVAQQTLTDMNVYTC